MKKALTTLAVLAMSVFAAQAQYTTLGVGITPPVGTLHVHSATPYTPLYPPNGDNGGDDPDVYQFNYKPIIHITNPNIGTNETDGFSIIQYNEDVTLRQFESGSLQFLTPGGGIIISSTGKVGIGNVNENYKFNVTGSARITGSTSINGNLFVGGTINLNNNFSFDANGNFWAGRSARIGNGFYCDLDGNLKVMSLKVTQSDWPDYVFGNGHELMPINDVEQYIKQNGHLPNVPSAEKVEKDGIDVGEMNRLLLEKVEELTLYIIDLQKQVDEMKSK